MIVFFSDLDGTLLDHETYSFKPAKPALKALRKRNIPLILASSKTKAEMLPLAQAMKLDAPLIVENGAGITNFDSEDVAQPLYQKIRTVLDGLPPSIRSHYTGFGDWTPAVIAEKTGLSQTQSEMAAMREFSEPGLWDGTDADLEIFKTLIEESGFQAVRGGRFLTIMPKTSKADALLRLKAHYARISGENIITVALGDAPNDIAMLESADYGFIIANPAHAPLPPMKGEREGNIKRSSAQGPEGWNEMVLGFLDKHA